MTTATKQRTARGSGTKKTQCAFCSGTGKDPYEILSKLSNCQVCNGRGTVEIRTPTVACAYCHGTGRQRHTRLTCSACKGTGVITLAGPTAKCPDCGGSGKMRGADMPCALCTGAGVTAKQPAAPKRRQRTASKGRGAGKSG